jgi:hypothetical protein
MADRLTVEEQRWRAAIGARRYHDALAVWRRIAPMLEQLAAESPAPRRRPAGKPTRREAVPSPNAVEAPTRATGWVTAGALARELGVDTRTIKRQVVGQPFMQQLSDRLSVVHRERYFAWLADGRPAA